MVQSFNSLRKKVRLSKRVFEKSVIALLELVDEMTDEGKVERPSEFVQKHRYLPPSVTRLSGFYSFDNAPYLREILDFFDPRDPARFGALLKGVQIGYTVGVLENALLYIAHHIKNSPAMYTTADADLAKLRIEEYILPMFQQSGLAHILRSSDEDVDTNKKGATQKKMSWIGGGFLLPFGAKSPGKMKTFSVRYQLNDEIETFEEVKNFGDPISLLEDRTKSYEQTRKVFYGSTPGEEDSSRIRPEFEKGDQRYYFVPCVECGELQTLRFSGINKETGLVYGLKWEYDENGNLKSGSVRYVCKFCGHEHKNEDKINMLPDEEMGGRAKWIPTATPKRPHYKSWHISALYAPSWSYSWESCVQSYLEGWDPKNKKVINYEKYKVFYNSILGETFKVVAGKINPQAVSKHRRNYTSGLIPSELTVKATGSLPGFVILTADINGDDISAVTWAVCPGQRVFVLDYFVLKGKPTESAEDESWNALFKIITEKRYFTDDGNREYFIARSFIDSGYHQDVVYKFCEKFSTGVHPIKGFSKEIRNTPVKEFSQFTTAKGVLGFNFTVNLYKDTWAHALNAYWDSLNGEQPEYFFNAHKDISDNELKELTKEYKREKPGPKGAPKKFEWHRVSGARNELWDNLIYCSAGSDALIFAVCKETLKLDKVSDPIFWNWIEKSEPFFINRTPTN